jgi:vitamin B12 transporter
MVIGIRETVRGETHVVLPELVISANRYPVRVSDVGSSITVIGLEDILASRLPTVLELLRGVPGVDITQSGGAGRIASVTMRGASSSQVLVLVDGIRLNTATLGAYDLSSLRSENIERIEILRGPQSTLYGSEAIGGVISITTRKGRGDSGGDITAEAGSPEQYRSSAGLRGTSGVVDYSVAASHEYHDGLSAASAGTDKDDDRYENISLSGRAGLNFEEYGRADLVVRYFDSDIDVDGIGLGIGPTDDPNAVEEREGVIASLNVSTPVAMWWENIIHAGISSDELVGMDPDSEFGNFKIDNRNINANWQANLLPTDNNILSIGYSFEERSGESKGSFNEDVTIHSVYIQDQWNHDESLFAAVGARTDDHSEFGGESTFRGTLAHHAGATGLRLHGSVGTGFKAPTLSDLFFSGFGNPDLDPETSVGIDAGIEYVFFKESVVIDVTYFHNEFDDLISFDVTTSRPENISEAEAKGIELSANAMLGNQAELDLSYTYMDSEDKTTGAQLPRRPGHSGAILASMSPTEEFRSYARLLIVRERIDSDGSAMDNYERLDLNVEYVMNEHIFPYVRFENVLDHDYEEVNGFETAGFTAIGGVRAVW